MLRFVRLRLYEINSVDNNIFKGHLKRWNRDKGFGFIHSENEKRDIFIHISALKNAGRIPVVGDVIYYQIDFDKSGRKRAINAKIEGAARVKPTIHRELVKPYKKNKWIVRLLVLIFIIGIGVFLYKKITEQENLSGIENPLTIFSRGTQRAGNALGDSGGNSQTSLQIQGEGIVTKILPDDIEGSSHQRFILKLNTGQTLLVAHNIDLAPKINSLQEGDTVRFYGEYEWNSKGGIVHWTHDDPNARHIDGWLKHKGKTYN